eukprot:TRINITY_DN2746_c0_g2_i2.p2 TRINITY_DN2746_c0_g2~~TRINITY_DN2746_c0_g2_i2.p2  ORF type:complete len:232 (+),score=10.21 TRINITY_DN2746_c0_g2_i2:454-1149(+)
MSGVKEQLKPHAYKRSEPCGVTACFLHNEPASQSHRRAQGLPVRRRRETESEQGAESMGLDTKPVRSTHGQGEGGVKPAGGPNPLSLKRYGMSCGEGSKSNQVGRQLVLAEITLGLASRSNCWGQSYWMRGGPVQGTPCNQTPNTNSQVLGDRLRVKISVVKRRIIQIAGQGPQIMLSSQGGQTAVTTRMLAQKQPSFKECVIAHWSRSLAPIMIGNKHDTEAADFVRSGR